MHTSRSVITPTTPPAWSTTGSRPMSCSQRARATVERLSAPVQTRGLLVMHRSTIIVAAPGARSLLRASYPAVGAPSPLEFGGEVGERALERLSGAFAERFG